MKHCTSKFGVPCAGHSSDPNATAWIWIIAAIAVVAILVRYWLRGRRR